MSDNNALPPDVRARLAAIRQRRAKCAAYYEQCDIPGTENPDQASKDIDALLAVIDALLAERVTPPATTSAGAAEPGNAATFPPGSRVRIRQGYEDLNETENNVPTAMQDGELVRIVSRVGPNTYVVLDAAGWRAYIDAKWLELPDEGTVTP